MEQAEKRLIYIPVFFIILRIWGTVQFLISIPMSKNITPPGCITQTYRDVFFAFGILQVQGNPSNPDTLGTIPISVLLQGLNNVEMYHQELPFLFRCPYFRFPIRGTPLFPGTLISPHAPPPGYWRPWSRLGQRYPLCFPLSCGPRKTVSAVL